MAPKPAFKAGCGQKTHPGRNRQEEPWKSIFLNLYAIFVLSKNQRFAVVLFWCLWSNLHKIFKVHKFLLDFLFADLAKVSPTTVLLSMKNKLFGFTFVKLLLSQIVLRAAANSTRGRIKGVCRQRTTVSPCSTFAKVEHTLTNSWLGFQPLWAVCGGRQLTLALSLNYAGFEFVLLVWMHTNSLTCMQIPVERYTHSEINGIVIPK